MSEVRCLCALKRCTGTNLSLVPKALYYDYYLTTTFTYYKNLLLYFKRYLYVLKRCTRDTMITYNIPTSVTYEFTNWPNTPVDYAN